MRNCKPQPADVVPLVVEQQPSNPAPTPLQSPTATNSASTSVLTANPSPSPMPSPSPSPSPNPNQALQQQQQQLQAKPQLNQDQQEQVSFFLRTSVFTRKVCIARNKLALGVVKKLAIGFLNELFFVDNLCLELPRLARHLPGGGGVSCNLDELRNRLVLRKYNSRDDSFMPFSSACDIDTGCVICVELSNNNNFLQQHTRSVSPPSASSATVSTADSSKQHNQDNSPFTELTISHLFKPETHLKPTRCDACKSLLIVLRHQSFVCANCKRQLCAWCKQRANIDGDVCLTPFLLQASTDSVPSVHQQHQHQLNAELSASSSSSSFACGEGKKETDGRHAKRKSASGLLGFNFSPFSLHHLHHSNKTTSTSTVAPPPPPPSPARNSAGALEVLKHLHISDDGNAAEESQPCEQHLRPAGGITPSHKSKLSRSFQNLWRGEKRASADATAAGASSLQPAVAAAAAPASPHQAEGQTQVQNPTQLQCVHQSPVLSSQKSSEVSSSLSTHRSALDLRAQANQDDIGQAPVLARADEHKLLETAIDVDAYVCDASTRQEQAKTTAATCAVCGKKLAVKCMKCSSCSVQMHAHCVRLSRNDCAARVAAACQKRSATNSTNKPNSQCNTSPQNNNNNNNKQTTLAGEKGDSQHHQASRNSIRLHRLAPSVKRRAQTSATSSLLSLTHTSSGNEQQILLEGWLKHSTTPDEPQQRNYWRLCGVDICLFESDTETRYFKAIPLSKIARVTSALEAPTTTNTNKADDDLDETSEIRQGARSAEPQCKVSKQKHCETKVQMFALELTSGSTYFVEAASDEEANKWRALVEQLATRCKHQHQQQNQQSSRRDEPTLHHIKQTSATSTKQKQRSIQARQFPAPSSKTKPRVTIKLQKQNVISHLVAGKYLIEASRGDGGRGFEELGSGQFGKVYAAIAEYRVESAVEGLYSGVRVAIKEISKARFDLKQQAKLKNEALILSRLEHPGVVSLERVHDLDDKFYIVMEQLEDDMLEMIVSSDEKRLNERVTKFLTYQILEALKYLHSQNIAHCDLKPENVLLCEQRMQFPQVKLCDFGFAKIIEDNSFRCSLIGTPAYLAPEVVKGERYNRSVDLWSTGVIVYVSLSGAFPFSEGESIHDQITRASFMYPETPWSTISTQAKSFINSLMKDNSEQRLSASRAQMHEWIQDYQLWCDLCELEARVGRRWVTDDADFERWSRFAAREKLQVPRNAQQLHDALLNADNEDDS